MRSIFNESNSKVYNRYYKLLLFVLITFISCTSAVKKNVNLQNAIRVEDLQKVSDLIRWGADVNFTGFNKRTAIMLCGSTGNLEILEILLSNGSDINASDMSGNNVAYYVIHGYGKNKRLFLERLSKAGLNLEKKTKYSKMLFENALRQSSVDVLEFFRTNGYEMNNVLYFKSLENAIMGENLIIVDYLLSEYNDYYLKYMEKCATALVKAVEYNKTRMVKYFLERFKNIIIDHELCTSPILIASKNGNSVIIKMLINANMDVNTTDYTGTTPLIIATTNGRIDVVKLLLEKDAEINHKDKFNRSAIYYAVMNGYIDIVKILINNAGLYIDENDYHSLIKIAKENRQVNIITILNDLRMK